MKKSINRNEFNSIVKDMDGVINWDILYPKTGRPDLREKPSRYKTKKLLRALAEYNKAGGDDNFKAMRKSKKRELARRATGTSDLFRGYMLAGEVRIKNNHIKITFSPRRGEPITYDAILFDTEPVTVEELKREMEKAFRNRPHNATKMAMNNTSGNYLTVHLSRYEDMIDRAAKDFEKYKAMHKRGEYRTGERANPLTCEIETYNKGIADNPAKWMRGLLFKE